MSPPDLSPKIRIHWVYFPPLYKVLCFLSVKISLSSTINYFMMNFKATDEMEMDKYKKELAAWEKEKYRQKYEFCITENDLDADKRLSDDVEIVVCVIFDGKEYNWFLNWKWWLFESIKQIKMIFWYVIWVIRIQVFNMLLLRSVLQVVWDLWRRKRWK